MRLAVILLCAALASCFDRDAGDPDSWLGEACGVPNLPFFVDQRRKLLVLGEHQVQGMIRTENGLEMPPADDRQKQIERAMPCLQREAKARGLTVQYPVLNVDG